MKRGLGVGAAFSAGVLVLVVDGVSLASLSSGALQLFQICGSVCPLFPCFFG